MPTQTHWALTSTLLQLLSQIQEAIQEFRSSGVAATQADVIAHSMGGTITRTLENLPGFTGQESFGLGNVHKLISIGTPHLGSPLATQLLQTNNSCLRNLLAGRGNVAFLTATVAGGGVSGGVGDLQGDGFGGSLSEALLRIQPANVHEVATALIAGSMNSNNTSSLNCVLCAVNYIRQFRCQGNPLADSLTAGGWPTIFGQPSDGIVPRLSQFNLVTSGPEVVGLVHSSSLVGTAGLGFSGPSEIDPLDG